MRLYSVRCSRQVRQPTLKFIIVLLELCLCVSPVGNALGGQLDADHGLIDEHALFRAVGAMYGLDPDLIEAIAVAESHNDPRAISSKGAMGLMQLMPATASKFKVADPFDPVESTLGAARFLDYLRDQEDCKDIPMLLAAYNAGQGAVKQYHGIPPYAETRRYVRTVLRLYLLAESLERGSQRAAQNSAEPKTVASHEPTNGDQTVLDQLTDLRRQREAAGEGR